VVAGGTRRQDSVANAFAKSSKDVDIVLIHDAARPFVTREVIDRAIDGAERHGAAIAAVGVRDTVKQAGDAAADGSRLIRATISRESVFLAQKADQLNRQAFPGGFTPATEWFVPGRNVPAPLMDQWKKEFGEYKLDRDFQRFQVNRGIGRIADPASWIT
jgi:hypothetical protein